MCSSVWLEQWGTTHWTEVQILSHVQLIKYTNMFNAKRLNKKQERIQQIKREINEACKLAKWRVNCGRFYYDDILENIKLTGNSIIVPYYNYDCEYCTCYSNSVLDAIITGFSQHCRPTDINKVNFNKDDMKELFNFIPKYYETIINHPERAKLEMLLESLDVNNIRLVETMLEGDV